MGKIRDEVDAKKDEMDMKTWRIEVFNKGIWKNGYLITLARRGWPDEIPINPTVKSLLFLISAAGSVAPSRGIFGLSEKITDRITDDLNDELDKIFFKEPTSRMYKDSKFFEFII